MSNWEGGIRVNAFAAGGYLPSEVLGTKQEGLIVGEKLLNLTQHRLTF